MAKILKKKFFEIEIPLINSKFEAYSNSIEELKDKTKKDSLEDAFLALTGTAIREEAVKNQAMTGRARAWRR